ncbi:hypothetical protein BDV37DRAFT_33341 [Aspergillus pseudonomiae]|uniref:Uncharacterized protein n=1 Tax=Aspergillus pseudonomiae TaxID=1506151 RepID=A0A5N7CX07_9EURO|nr:uncharacterized protein BDV37DRAFT_33341 [Aspergillus pseudonomiae]KAE8398307.1 hypothetical protein BDV37DRAFT_33341 [Aspergillus pseudonomiae]
MTCLESLVFCSGFDPINTIHTALSLSLALVWSHFGRLFFFFFFFGPIFFPFFLLVYYH